MNNAFDTRSTVQATWKSKSIGETQTMNQKHAKKKTKRSNSAMQKISLWINFRMCGKLNAWKICQH